MGTICDEGGQNKKKQNIKLINIYYHPLLYLLSSLLVGIEDRYTRIEDVSFAIPPQSLVYPTTDMVVAPAHPD